MGGRIHSSGARSRGAAIGLRRGLAGIGVAALASALLVWAVPASASAPSPHASSPFAGVWAGTLTLSPTPVCVKEKPACPTPIAVQVELPAFTTSTTGTVTFPGWHCAGAFEAAATSTGLSFSDVGLVSTGTYDCTLLEGTGTWTVPINGQSTWQEKAPPGKLFGSVTGFNPQSQCSGAGSCDTTAPSPQIICLSAASCPPGGSLASTVTVGAFQGGHLAPNTAVTIHFLSPSKAHDTTGSWCQASNGRVKTGRTNSLGLFSFSYTAAGSHTPPIASFCVIRATVGRATITSAIDQTNDPAPWTVRGTPTPVTRVNVPSSKARLYLFVKNPNGSPTYVNNDPTAVYSEIPSTTGACGAISPIVKKTGHPNGRSTLIYSPSTVGGTPSHKVFCTLVGQEADTGATSNRIVVYQRKE